MNQQPNYTEHHPRWYRTRVSTYWWLEKPAYFLFILRELSSVFVAWFVVFLLMLVAAVTGGAESYRQFLAWAARPGVVALNVVSLLFVLLHTITWFNLAPQAMAVRFRGKRVPGIWIAGSNYAAWVIVSGVVLWLIVQ
ncbi:MAG: fumarate reductase subunit C [Planctomycetia bacterium]|nr:fumarate reductase subunit C [Planctomycetia bacterium]